MRSARWASLTVAWAAASSWLAVAWSLWALPTATRAWLNSVFADSNAAAARSACARAVARYGRSSSPGAGCGKSARAARSSSPRTVRDASSASSASTPLGAKASNTFWLALASCCRCVAWRARSSASARLETASLCSKVLSSPEMSSRCAVSAGMSAPPGCTAMRPTPSI